jgi:hypothetical protein
VGDAVGRGVLVGVGVGTAVAVGVGGWVGTKNGAALTPATTGFGVGVDVCVGVGAAVAPGDEVGVGLATAPATRFAGKWKRPSSITSSTYCWT